MSCNWGACLSECFKEADLFGVQNGDIDGAGDMDEEMEDPDLEPVDGIEPFDGDPPVGDNVLPPPLGEPPLFTVDEGFTGDDGMEIDCCYNEDGVLIPYEEEPGLIDERPDVIIDPEPEDEPPDENIDIGEDNPNVNVMDEGVDDPPPLEDPRDPPVDPLVVQPPITPLFPLGLSTFS